MKIQEKIISQIDTNYAYQLAKRMEKHRTHPQLGYRTAGSEAEFETGELLRREMEAIGLSNVHKDAVKVDGWTFRKAELRFTGADGTEHCAQLGAYQTNFVTDGAQVFHLLSVGRGTEADYAGKDVKGKLVLGEINQRDEWWINYPVYQAHLKSAAAFIAVQSGGYGEIDDEALNAQDIAGPADAPAFSISRKDAKLLYDCLAASPSGEIEVRFDADSRVYPDCTTYNIIGSIPGKHPDRIVLLSAHYDSYFDGFQDDNTAIAMLLGIACALLKAGFKPNNTIIFCAMAAEEWGVIDSNFDWSTGAYEEIFTARPEWRGKVIVDLNFELPALAHGTRARIRSCYEYTAYLEEFLAELPNLTHAYPEETRVTAPIETWSDDFSMAIAGIPSMVNDFTGGSFMETNYHSQFDSDAYYDEQVYRLHHELFALLIEALDRTAIAPLCFAPVMKRAADGAEEDLSFAGDVLERRLSDLRELLEMAEERAERAYEQIDDINRRYSALLTAGKEAEAERLYQASREKEQAVLRQFQAEQDAFVRIDWYGNVYYPHELLIRGLKLLKGIIRNLKEGNLSAALKKLYQIDNNAYAFMFDEEVYRHFTDYVLEQPRERLKWGYKRLMEHENLYKLVKGLLEKQKTENTDYEEEIRTLESLARRRLSLLHDTADELYQEVKEHFI